MAFKEYICQYCSEDFGSDVFRRDTHEKYCLKNPEFSKSIGVSKEDNPKPSKYNLADLLKQK